MENWDFLGAEKTKSAINKKNVQVWQPPQITANILKEN